MQRLFARLLAQDPRSWSPADRVLLVTSGIIPFGLVWAVLGVLVGARTRGLLADAFEWAAQATDDGAAFAVAASA